MYCKVGEKPKLNYSFNNGKKKTFEASVSPVDVQIKDDFQENYSGGQCEDWYGFVYQTVDFPTYGTIQHSRDRGVGFKGSIFYADIKLVDRYRDYSYAFNYAWYIYVGATGGDDVEPVDVNKDNVGIYRSFLVYQLYSPNPPNFLGFERYNPSGGDIPPDDNCGDPKPTCEINVIHNGSTIFTDRGNCPVEYEVQCGDCPSNHIRCQQPGYPGYCCLPCDPIAQRINNLAARL